MALAIATVNAILIGLVLALAVSIEQLVTILPNYTDRAQELLSGLHGQLTSWGVGAGQAHDLLWKIDPRRFGPRVAAGSGSGRRWFARFG
ncbi:hypothetical protein G4X40_04940 [Rhodococcus sp. D2-41]|uniref:Uncharacterized protein n=1 Tax=Speluncibacter jeojiensis TaxID=2710754 RepID=A0A9X4RFL8_9ACTN|nr:hypothetical protein [Rhodococcus sp. D2-41]MDG3009488.1 hypothetical protein [Rhodococcus sp. D2-41]MDG3016417.1 hypothetical protein [Corynebacteriales bacterium D3-21]